MLLFLHFTGSDLLSAITATFEEKMRSLQESPLVPVSQHSGSGGGDGINADLSTTDEGRQHHHAKARGNPECRLYRDPSLHRRRTTPRGPSINPSTASNANSALTTTTSQVSGSMPNPDFLEFSSVLVSFHGPAPHKWTVLTFCCD